MWFLIKNCNQSKAFIHPSPLTGGGNLKSCEHFLHIPSKTFAIMLLGYLATIMKGHECSLVTISKPAWDEWKLKTRRNFFQSWFATQKKSCLWQKSCQMWGAEIKIGLVDLISAIETSVIPGQIKNTSVYTQFLMKGGNRVNKKAQLQKENRALHKLKRNATLSQIRIWSLCLSHNDAVELEEFRPAILMWQVALLDNTVGSLFTEFQGLCALSYRLA